MSTILDALKKKYEAEIEEGKVNIKINIENQICKLFLLKLKLRARDSMTIDHGFLLN